MNNENFIIAICTDTMLFNQNKMFDYSFAKNYFGLAFAPILKSLLPDLSFVTGDIALEKLRNNEIKSTNIYVISSEKSKQANKLITYGGVPLCTYCLESLMYAKKFYKNIQGWSNKFKNTIYFKGSYQEFIAKPELNKMIVFFPSYNEKDIIEPKPVAGRKFISLVVGNKYIGRLQNIKLNRNTFKGFFKYLFKYSIFYSQYRQYLFQNELQTKRLELIEIFGQENLLGLFGNGWNNIDNLPQSWQKRLSSIIDRITPQPIDDKLSIISNYKFNLCIENLRYGGYITEKIIHSFVAGVVPVYLGAPDILDFIPKNCFIDVRDFKSDKELMTYLRELTEEEINEYIQNGREFLFSTMGKAFSFKNFALQLKQIIEKEIQSHY